LAFKQIPISESGNNAALGKTVASYMDSFQPKLSYLAKNFF